MRTRPGPTIFLYVPFMIYDSPVDTARRPATARAGRPRSERARLAVLEACADLLVEGGLGAASIEAIAARAGVSKVTIYKWWPSRGSVAVDAFFHRYRQTINFPDTGDLAADLIGQIRMLITAVDASRRGWSQRDRRVAASAGSDCACPMSSAMIEPARPRNAVMSIRICPIRSAARSPVSGKLMVWR